MEKRKKEGEQTKQRIADKAKELFSQKGYAATSMEEITEAAQTSKGNIYYHFKSKENLFLYLLEQSMVDWIEKWKMKCAAYSSAKEKLYGIAEHTALEFASPLIKALEEFAGSQLADRELLEKVTEISNLPLFTYREVVEEGMASGEFKQGNVDEITLILSGFLAGVGSYYNGLTQEEMLALYKKSVDIILYGMAAS